MRPLQRIGLPAHEFALIVNIALRFVPLLAQVQADFPGAVVDYAEIAGETAYVTLTRWEAYPPYAGGFDVLYDRAAGGWEYSSSEQW